MNKISNPKTEVPQTTEMTDQDYLNDILQNEKCLSNNLAIALSEASNDNFYKELMSFLVETKDNAHELYNLMFKNGWYSLEEAKKNQTEQKLTEFQARFDNEIK